MKRSHKNNYKIGDVKGMLKVVKIKGANITFKCNCGKLFSDSVSRLNKRISCGCMRGKSTLIHGMSKTKFHTIWKSINARCYNKNSATYKDYGAKGIVSKWKDNFMAFKKDMYKSYLEHVKKHGEKKTTIERIDYKLSYEKKNCKWATPLEQANNKSNTILVKYKGKIISISNLARKLNIPVATLRKRVQRNWRQNELSIQPIIGRNQSWRKL